MKEIICISLNSPANNYNKTLTFKGEKYRIQRFGTNFDLELAEQLVKSYDGECDVICLSGFPSSINISGKKIHNPQTTKIKNSAILTPVVDGYTLKDMVLPLSVNLIPEEAKLKLRNKTVGFYSGFLMYSTIADLENKAAGLYFADPYFMFNMPIILKNKSTLDTFLKNSSKFY